MKRLGAPLCMVLALASGCASNPGAVYGHLQSTDKFRIVSNLGEAIRSVPAAQLEGSSERTVKIERTDQVINLGAYYSYFKLLKMNAAARTSYKLTVESLCHCFGHTKTVVVPHVYLLNDHGKLIAEGPDNTKTHGPGLTSNLKLRGTMDFQVPEDGVYFVVVAGDNGRVGAPVETVHDSYWQPSVSPSGKVEGGSMVKLGYDIVSSPIGKVVLRMAEATAK